MKTKTLLTTLPCGTMLLFASLWLAACSSSASSGTVIALGDGVHVWLDQPPTGVGLPIGAFTLKAHARDTAGGGVQKIVFLVNTIPLGTINTDPTLPLVYGEFGWNPSVAGSYSIQAQAFNATGSALSETALVCVGPDCVPATAPAPALPQPKIVTATPQVLVVPSATRTPAVATPSRTATRNVPPTPTKTTAPPPPPAQTGCSGTPIISSFTASPLTISPGGSSTLSWGTVTNADAVQVDPGIGGVAAPGSTSVSPGGTTVYTLTARCKGVPATRQVTIVVQGAPPPPPPQDTTPPAISGVKPNSNTLTDQSNCTYPTSLTITAGVTDASGVASVQLLYRFGSTGNWNSAAMNSSGGGSYNATIDAASLFKGKTGTIEYYVTARDNPGNSTNSNTLTVSFITCPG